jgi:hypothetical protein
MKRIDRNLRRLQSGLQMGSFWKTNPFLEWILRSAEDFLGGFCPSSSVFRFRETAKLRGSPSSLCYDAAIFVSGEDGWAKFRVHNLLF